MKTIIESDPSTPLIAIHLECEGGAVTDPADRHGLADFTMDMLLRGAGEYSALGLAAAFDRIGASIQTHAGRESVSVTVYTIPRSLDAAVKLLAEVIGAPTFPTEEVEKTRRQKRADLLGIRDHDRYLAGRAYRRTLFAGHPYGRTVTGSDAGLSAITGDDLRAFHRAHFTQDRAILAVAGAVTSEDGQAVAENLCGALPAGGAVNVPVMDPLVQRGRHLVVVDKPDRAQVTFTLGQLGARYDDADYPAMTLAAAIFGAGTFHSRLMRELRTARGWTYGAHAAFDMVRARGDFFLSCAVAERDAPGALTLQLELFEALAAHGVTEEELEFAKGYLCGGHVFHLDTATKRAIARVYEAFHGLPEGYFVRYPEAIRKVTVEEVNAAVRVRLDPQHLAIAAVATHERVGAKLSAAIPGVSTVTVLPFDGD